MDEEARAREEGLLREIDSLRFALEGARRTVDEVEQRAKNSLAEVVEAMEAQAEESRLTFESKVFNFKLEPPHKRSSARKRRRRLPRPSRRAKQPRRTLSG